MLNFGLVAFALAVSGAVPSVGQARSDKPAAEAAPRDDYVASVVVWRPLAEAGDADAAFNLGQAYRLGRGVKANPAEAQTWFERAARKGHIEAQTTLGLMLYEMGNRVAALRWLKMAAAQGEPRALLIYGTALYNGDAVVRDPVLGYAYVSRAAAQGLGPAQRTLAEMDHVLPREERQQGLALAQPKPTIIKVTANPAEQPVAARPESKPAAKLALAKPAPALPLEIAPAAPAAAAAQTVGKPVGEWRIQLGAFSKRASAEGLFANLSGVAPLAGRQPYYVDAGAVTRLQAGPFENRAAATAACTALSRQGQPCFPVAAK
ncbi:MAG: SPOR domain-containing protein [Sphingomicrobium sp.]